MLIVVATSYEAVYRTSAPARHQLLPHDTPRSRFAPLIPIFRIIGTVSVNRSLPGGLEYEYINAVNGVFQYNRVVARLPPVLPEPLGVRISPCRYREAGVISMCEVGLVGGYGVSPKGNNVDSEIDLIRLENGAHKC